MICHAKIYQILEDKCPNCGNARISHEDDDNVCCSLQVDDEPNTKWRCPVCQKTKKNHKILNNKQPRSPGCSIQSSELKYFGKETCPLCGESSSSHLAHIHYCDSYQHEIRDELCGICTHLRDEHPPETVIEKIDIVKQFDKPPCAFVIGEKLKKTTKHGITDAHGISGTLYSVMCDANNTDYVAKIMYTPFINTIQNEIELQQRAASYGLAPVIYEYRLHREEGNPTICGTIIMDRLNRTIEEMEYNDEMSKNVEILVEKLHKIGIFHGDLAKRNIMFDRNNQLKLIDFGSSREYRGKIDDRDEYLNFLLRPRRKKRRSKKSKKSKTKKSKKKVKKSKTKKSKGRRK